MPEHFVLKHWFPMVGMDFHMPWPPGAPSPLPPAPYQTSSLLIGLVPKVFSKPLSSHRTDGFAITMAKDTDIGSFIRHVGAPSITLTLEEILSASKSHWGASRYLAEGEVMGCCLLISVNPNLNCGYPAPTPTGFVVGLTTHTVKMTLGDILSGLASMCADIAIQWALGKLGSWTGNKITTAIMRRMRPKIWANTFYPVLRRLGQSAVIRESYDYAARYAIANRRATEAILRYWRQTGRIAEAGVGSLLGGPLGADAETVGMPTIAGAASGAVNESASAGGQELGDMLDPPEPVNNYNSGPGAPGVVN